MVVLLFLKCFYINTVSLWGFYLLQKVQYSAFKGTPVLTSLLHIGLTATMHFPIMRAARTELSSLSSIKHHMNILPLPVDFEAPFFLLRVRPSYTDWDQLGWFIRKLTLINHECRAEEYCFCFLIVWSKMIMRLEKM